MRACWTVLASMLVFCAMETREAEACSCGAPLTIPADDTAGLPTNLERILVDPDDGSKELILEATDERVPLSAPTAAGRWQQYELLAELLPNQTYMIGRGDLVFSRFTTGPGPDLEAPTATLHSIEITRATLVGEENGCGDNELSALQADLTLGADVIWNVVRLTGPDMDLSGEVPSSHGGISLLGFCGGAGRDYTAGAEYCYEGRPRDWAGNIGAPTTACTVARSCGTVSDLEAWNEDPIACGGQSGGCSTTSSPGGLLLVGLALLVAFRSRSGTR